MGSAREQDGLTSYAVTRWPDVVRTLVLLGAPPAETSRLAGVAVGRLLDAPASHDLAVALFAEVVGAWEEDAEAWWRTAVPVVDQDLEIALDRLDPATRARLVLTVVAELDDEQVDEVVLGGGAWPTDLGPAAARAAGTLDPGPPSDAVLAAGRTSRERSRRRRTGWVVGLVATAALVVGGVLVLVDPTEPLPVERDTAGAGVVPPGLPVRVPTIIVRGGGDLPAPWYDGDFVHVAGPDASTALSMDLVKVEGLLSMTVVEGGVAGVLGDGTVVFVGPDGMQPLGRARGGSTPVGSPSSPGVAWLGVDGDLVVARVPPAVIEVDLPPGARLIARDAGTTYVALREGHLVVRDDGRVRRLPSAVPLDVAGDTKALATRDGIQVGGVPLAGVYGARLSEDGRFVLTSSPTSSSSALSVVVDTSTGLPVDLPVPDDGRVLDAALGPDSVVTFVLSRPDGARFPRSVPRGDGAQSGYDLVTCRLLEGTCEATAQLDAFEEPPLVAH